MSVGDLARATAIAATQLGLITSEQAAITGLSTAQVMGLVRRGVWDHRCMGLYAVAGAPRNWRQDALAACLIAGPSALLCYGAAARLLEVGRPHFEQATVEIMVPRGGRREGAAALGAVVHESRHVAAEDRARVDGIPVTKASRLVVDMLGRVPTDVLYALADDVLWRSRDRRLIRQTWERVGGGRRGRLLEAVLLPWGPGPKPGSPKEMSLARVLQLHDLPRPLRQHPVWLPGRERPRLLDLAYPQALVAPEYDGRRDHGPRHWEHDAAREDELASVGWLRIPAGRLDLVEPGATAYCATVMSALVSRGASPSPAPRADGGEGAEPCFPNPAPR